MITPSKKSIIIFLILVILMASSFLLRTYPSYGVEDSEIINYVSADDPMYSLRQIEHMVQNFPYYQNFDPMTLYPYGQYLNWGPMLTWICSFICVLCGAATRPEIIRVSLYIPPLMASLMIPLIYVIGKKLYSWKVGIVSSIFVTFVFGQFFTRSMYGYLDHHIAEVLFSSLFLLAYIYAVEHVRKIDIYKEQTKFFIYSISSGFAFMLGLFVMPTMLLFALVVALYAILQLVVDAYEKVNSLYLVLLNMVVFGVFGNATMIIFYNWSEVLTLVNYSHAHSVVYTLLVVGTACLYLIKDNDKVNAFIKKKPLYFIGGIIGSVVFALIAMPQSWRDFVDGGVRGFFGTTALSLTVQEARGWTLQDAIGAFNFGLILFALGVIVLLYYSAKERKPSQLLVVMWTLVITFSAWQHIRYEYYIAIPIALLSGFFVGDVIEYRGKELYTKLKSVTSEEIDTKPLTRKEKRRKIHRSKPIENKFEIGKYIGLSFVVFASVMSFMFVYTSASSEYTMVSYSGLRLNPDWRQSLEWFGENSPDTGVDYYGVYSQYTFEYPETAYGVMSWWDYGHMITYIPKRIPNSNPFQAGVAGPDGSAAFFMQESEDDVTKIIENIGTKYVITDVEMSMTKFWAMATWYNSTLGVYPYQMTIHIPSDKVTSSGTNSMILTDKYYRTIVSRLHNYDGSYVSSMGVVYLELDSRNLKKTLYPAVTNAIQMDYKNASIRKDSYNTIATDGMRAVVVSINPNLPAEDIQALEHFRLIYESDTSVGGSETNAMKYVKIFEYVNGYRTLLQPGFVELQVKTNTGRVFNYIQKSEDGVYILPYSTIDGKYETTPVSKYHLVGTDIYFDVTEDQIQ